MSLIPPPEGCPVAYGNCQCQCHHVPNIKHIMPCCHPAVFHSPEPTVVMVEPRHPHAVVLNADPGKSDRQLLRELFYASLPTGQRLEEKLIEWEMEDLWREVYARLERR